MFAKISSVHGVVCEYRDPYSATVSMCYKDTSDMN